MRTPYSPEIEQQVIEKYLSGEAVREISDSMGVSVGYVSNCIENFSSKLDKNTINVLHDFYKIIRKSGLNPKDAFSGYAVFSIITKYKLDVNQINSFIESVLLFAKQNELSAEQLVDIVSAVIPFLLKYSTDFIDLSMESCLRVRFSFLSKSSS